jgi:hypothetical protein
MRLAVDVPHKYLGFASFLLFFKKKPPPYIYPDRIRFDDPLGHSVEGED